MTDHRNRHSAARTLVVICLSLLLLVPVILSVVHDTAPGKTVDEWHAENPDASAAQLININTATPEELQQLENLGAVTAERIVAYRERFVRFTSVKELANVKGISEADVERWSSYITV